MKHYTGRRLCSLKRLRTRLQSRQRIVQTKRRRQRAFQRPIRLARSTLSTLFARGQQRCVLGRGSSDAASGYLFRRSIRRASIFQSSSSSSSSWRRLGVARASLTARHDGPFRHCVRHSLCPATTICHSPPGRTANYSDRRVCMYVRPSDRISQNSHAKTSRNTWMICRPRWGGATPITFQGDL